MADCWSVRARDEASAPAADYRGTHVADHSYPEPDPAPATALAQLDEAYEVWLAGVRSLGERLTTPVGPAEGPFADRHYTTLVLHIHREVIHHGAEILLLRDLYRNR